MTGKLRKNPAQSLQLHVTESWKVSMRGQRMYPSFQSSVKKKQAHLKKNYSILVPRYLTWAVITGRERYGLDRDGIRA